MISPRGYVFIGLNAVRFLSIVGLLLVFSSSIFVLVNDIRSVNHFMSIDAHDRQGALENCDYIQNSTVPNQAAGEFWAVLNRLLIIFQVIALIVSESGFVSGFFERYFPMLGPNFGLGALGMFECFIGAAILSHHVDDVTLVSAFFLFSVGCLNMLLGLIFRESARPKRSLRNFREEHKGVLPLHADKRPTFARVSRSFVAGHFEKTRSPSPSEHTGQGFGRQGEKAAAQRGYMISRPIESLPRYTAPRPTSIRSTSSRSSGSHYASTRAPTPAPPASRPMFYSSHSAL